MSKPNQFDPTHFSALLLQKRCVEKRISMRDAAREIGISAATLSRLENKKTPDIQTYYQCCIWLEIDMRHCFKIQSDY